MFQEVGQLKNGKAGGSSGILPEYVREGGSRKSLLRACADSTPGLVPAIRKEK